MMTCGQIIEEMLNAVGKTRESVPTVDPWDVLNEAGHRLVNFRDWTWRTVGPVDVRAKAGQDYIELPYDFDAVISAAAINSGTSRTTIIGLGRLIGMQAANNQSLGSGWFVAFDTVRPTTAKSEKIGRRLYVWPRPQADGVPTLRLVYKSRWSTMSEKMDVDTRPNVPDEYQRALVMLARGFFVQRVEQRDPDLGAAMEEINAMAMADGRRQMEYGPITGTRLGPSDRSNPPMSANLEAP